MLKKLRDEKGFTLLEMAIVILVIAALLLIIIPNVSGVENNVDQTTNEALENTIETQKILYEMDDRGDDPTPADLEAAGYITEEQLEAHQSSNTE